MLLVESFPRFEIWELGRGKFYRYEEDMFTNCGGYIP